MGSGSSFGSVKRTTQGIRWTALRYVESADSLGLTLARVLERAAGRAARSLVHRFLVRVLIVIFVVHVAVGMRFPFVASQRMTGEILVQSRMAIDILAIVDQCRIVV
jgi:hypothetical protein